MTDVIDREAKEEAGRLTRCPEHEYEEGCPNVRAAVAARIAELKRALAVRECQPDAGRHYTYAGDSHCVCRLFVRELHARRVLAGKEQRLLVERKHAEALAHVRQWAMLRQVCPEQSTLQGCEICVLGNVLRENEQLRKKLDKVKR